MLRNVARGNAVYSGRARQLRAVGARASTRRFAGSVQNAAPARRVTFVHFGVLGAGASAGAAWWFLRTQKTDFEVDVEDIELPLVPAPSGNFVHPYEEWSWYRRFWFTVRRSLFLAWTFAPFFRASAAVMIFPEDRALRERWLEAMHTCMQRAGAAFQKFGQWLSMRPDMFPPDVIEVLSRLRSDAPSHPVAVSRKTLQEQLGHEVEELFDEFEDEPVASGSVGQVHKARLRPEFALDRPHGRLCNVAVKVRHPGVADSAFMDLNILWGVVAFSEKFLHMTTPFDRGEFDEVIQAQMDFTREAHNLQRFARNFRGERRIRFPKVSPRFVTSEVLVETWADGKVISHILEDFDNARASCGEALSALKQKKREMQKRLCGTLYDMSMKMMVRDNFVHGDLHGGNILYMEGDDHVTVLDAGIATSLDRKTFSPFCRFLHALCSGRTDGIVRYLQDFNESKIKPNAEVLRQDIQEIMDKFMGPLRQNPELPVNAADMFGEVMFSLQKHGMLLKGDVASTLFTISISEGLIRQLDPTFDVATNALPYIAQNMRGLLLAED